MSWPYRLNLDRIIKASQKLFKIRDTIDTFSSLNCFLDMYNPIIVNKKGYNVLLMKLCLSLKAGYVLFFWSCQQILQENHQSIHIWKVQVVKYGHNFSLQWSNIEINLFAEHEETCLSTCLVWIIHVLICHSGILISTPHDDIWS